MTVVCIHCSQLCSVFANGLLGLCSWPLPLCVAVMCSLCPSSSRRSPSCPLRMKPACHPCSMCCVLPHPQPWSFMKRHWPTSTKVVARALGQGRTRGLGRRKGELTWTPIWVSSFCYSRGGGDQEWGCGVRWITFPSCETSVSLSVFIWKMDIATLLLLRPNMGNILCTGLPHSRCLVIAAIVIIAVYCDHNRCPFLHIDSAHLAHQVCCRSGAAPLVLGRWAAAWGARLHTCQMDILCGDGNTGSHCVPQDRAWALEFKFQL